MSAIHTVVVAVDFSENSKTAVRMAAELVRLRHGRVHLLHVVPDVFHAPWMAEAPGVDFDRLREQWVEDARTQLVTLAAGEGLDPRHVTIAIAVGAPAMQVVQYAKEHAADTIVLGSHGHGPIRRFMLGSVADRVLRHATCPVTVVPHQDLTERGVAVGARLARES
jgi:nucleotide-binding universal stress UspA family protein